MITKMICLCWVLQPPHTKGALIFMAVRKMFPSWKCSYSSKKTYKLVSLANYNRLLPTWLSSFGFWGIGPRERGLQTNQLLPIRFDSSHPSADPLREAGRPTFDLSVRSNFPPPPPLLHPPSFHRIPGGRSSSQTNETNCISSEE